MLDSRDLVNPKDGYINRAFDTFTSLGLQSAHHQYAFHQTAAKLLHRLDDALNPQSECGIAQSLPAFFGALEEMCLAPESDPARSGLIEHGRTLGMTIQAAASHVHNLQHEVDMRIQDAVHAVSEGDTTPDTDSTAMQETKGTLNALENFRDAILSDCDRILTSLATSLRDECNHRHRAGYGLDLSTGLDFFKGNKADDMTVNEEIKHRPAKIGASISGKAADGTIARSLAELRHERFLSGGKATYEEAFASLLADLRMRRQGAEKLEETFAVIVQCLTDQKDLPLSITFDEELTNVERLQKGFTTGIKVVRAVDEVTTNLLRSAP